MGAALRYHRATDVEAGGTDEDEQRYVGDRPPPFKEYGEAQRLPPESSVAGPLLQDGAGIVRSQERRDYGGGTIHWRAYSSAGGLFPVEAYVAAADGLYSFDPLTPGLVRLAEGDARAAVGAAAASDGAEAFVVLTGIHARTGWKYMERGYRHTWWDAGTMLANLLALAAADGLDPRLHVGFHDRELNGLLGIDGTSEYALAVLALGRAGAPVAWTAHPAPRASAEARRFPLAEAAHTASAFSGTDAVRAWQSPEPGAEPKLPRDELLAAIRRRSSVRRYSDTPLPRDAFAELLDWSEAPIPADVPSVVEQLVTLAAVEGLEPGIYDAQLTLLRARDRGELRQDAGFAAMEQDHPQRAAANVFQMADLDGVVERLGERGYRWAQLEAGIRAGRLQIGAFMRGWGAAASTFYDVEVSKLLETDASPLLMVAVGARRGYHP
jgi:SagB-type dehydrogenase family enzyme